jgi:hypothetical protein
MRNDKLSCDYINSGYYQLIYESDTAYLSGNRQVAYEKIRQAEQLCPLIEQMMYFEISRYIELLVANNQYDKAGYYIRFLVQNYGYQIELFEAEEYFEQLKKQMNWEIFRLELENLYEDFYSRVDTCFVKELQEMSRIDQEIRKDYHAAADKRQALKKMQVVDSMNEVKMKQFFEQYGYPNTRLWGRKNDIITAKPSLSASIPTMLMHFSDTAYFKPKLFQFIKKGECPPRYLGDFVDSYARKDTAQLKYIYGIYSNSLDKVKDFQNLDDRRRAIGMPALKLEQKRDSLIRIKYNYE